MVPWASVAVTGACPQHRRLILPTLDVPELPLIGQTTQDKRRSAPSRSVPTLALPPAAPLKPELVAHTVCMRITASFEDVVLLEEERPKNEKQECVIMYVL
ncbi:hypothetical protein DFH06DRAFT_1335645 [Mycena polygramma]|nr:hypothetical protein DFH06DRAFT_1335645 [Mycena polygramma]